MAQTAKIFQRPNWNQSWHWDCCYTSTALSQTSCSGWPCRLCHWTLTSHNTQQPPSVALLCLPKARFYLSSQESRLSTYSKYYNKVLERNQEDKKSLLFFFALSSPKCSVGCFYLHISKFPYRYTFTAELFHLLLWNSLFNCNVATFWWQAHCAWYAPFHFLFLLS